MTQLAFEQVEGYETEHLEGATAPAFPVIIQPTTAGADVIGPPGVEYLSWIDRHGQTHVELWFPRP